MTAYQSQLDDKTRRLNALLTPFNAPTPDIYPSPSYGYRMRAEFRLWHDGDDCYHAMTATNGNIERIDTFPPVHHSINALMPQIIDALQQSQVLRYRLFQIEYHAAQSGEIMVSLIYHKVLDAHWQQAAENLAHQLNINLIGRSRKNKHVIGRDYITETLHIDGRDYHYRQYENSFSQPNANICQQMLQWTTSHAGSDADLLELYCGNGNFTLPLSTHYRRILATEISKSGIRALRENLIANCIHNVAVARLSAHELAQAIRGDRPFRRLQQDSINLSNYHFDTVFVDPPRAGIDDDTLNLLTQYPRIIYISCNPDSLIKNLHQLCRSHRISACALFDQFPFTPHIESGVILER
ncbi:MAG: tRNA (uridine(54)-C5)-methyltransferase TrmA [Cardiobacteriaceae bacterium]|nr:tRNA (uridine(54)-C5)-methyltransferase TrmA [Cardiobacteriaceae bacterium]